MRQAEIEHSRHEESDRIRGGHAADDKYPEPQSFNSTRGPAQTMDFCLSSHILPIVDSVSILESGVRMQYLVSGPENWIAGHRFCVTLRCWATSAGSFFILPCTSSLNSLRPSDAIWRQINGSTLAQVMACCLTAPSHYLNQYSMTYHQ